MRIHACFRDAECVKEGAPKRLYIHTKWFSIMIGEKSQVWLPKVGYTDKWFWITFRPT